MSEEIKIRDNRDGGWFPIDNELLEVYGPELGVYCIAVYNALSMYANRNTQTCYPSYNTIASLISCSRRQVIRSVKKMAEFGILHITERSLPSGFPNSNMITLTNKSTWKPISNSGEGSERSLHAVVTGSHRDSQSPANDHSAVDCESPGTASHQPRDSQSPKQESSEQETTSNTNVLEGGKPPQPPSDSESQNDLPEPANLTLKQIKTHKLTAAQWQEWLDNEKSGRERSTVIEYIEQKLNHGPPAVQVYRENTNRYPPKKLWGKIADAVGEGEEALDRWGETVAHYIGCGWNPTNVITMLEFFNRGEIPGIEAKNGQTGTDQSQRSANGKAPGARKFGGGRPQTDADRYAEANKDRLANLIAQVSQ